MRGVPFDDSTYRGPRVVDVGRHADLARHTGPNGWFVGPVSAPDQFQLLGPGLGGGEGITWRARYRGIEAAPLALAVKQLRRPPDARFDWPSPADRRRWDKQKELLQFLAIDHLATLLDIFIGAAPHPEGEATSAGVPPTTPYVVMEWVPGRTLVDEFGGIAATASTLGQRLTHLQDVAGALHEVHSRIAHSATGVPALLRDIKPDNCVLDPARGVVLVDVGTLRLMDGYHHQGFHRRGYIAPEVLDDPLAAREPPADLYSLGALAYFCVLGEDPPPLAGHAGASQLIGRELLAAARAARVADPHGFVDHLRLMLHPQPDQRPADAAAWARQLRALAARRGRLGSTGARVAVAASLAIAGAFALSATTIREKLDTGTRFEPSVQTVKPASGADAVTTLGSGTLTVPPTTAHSTTVKISAPADDGKVRQCEPIEGSARLPSGTTLVLSTRDLSARTAGDPVRRWSPVDHWQRPSSLRAWRARQPFDASTSSRSGGGERSGPASQSHRFRLDVLVVDLAELRQQIRKARRSGDDWRSVARLDTAVVGDSISFNRISGICGTP